MGGKSGTPRLWKVKSGTAELPEDKAGIAWPPGGDYGTAGPLGIEARNKESPASKTGGVGSPGGKVGNRTEQEISFGPYKGQKCGWDCRILWHEPRTAETLLIRLPDNWKTWWGSQYEHRTTNRQEYNHVTSEKWCWSIDAIINRTISRDVRTTMNDSGVIPWQVLVWVWCWKHWCQNSSWRSFRL